MQYIDQIRPPSEFSGMNSEPIRYRLRRKTKDPLSQEGNLLVLAAKPGPNLEHQLERNGKRTIVISSKIGLFSKRINPSHVLGHTRGIIWCWRCGAYAISAPQTLAEACPGGCDTYGRAVLSRIKRGLTPRSDVKWPDRGATAENAPPDLAIIAASHAPLPDNWVARKRKRSPAGNVFPAFQEAGLLRRGRAHRRA